MAEAHGLTVEVAAISAIPDLTIAAQSLVDKGVDAFLLPSDMLTMSGLPAIMQIATENSIPVFHSTAHTINLGATVSAGTAQYARQGNLIGAMLVGHLRGELDIASTGIGLVDQLDVGLNLDSAAAQGIEISPALMEQASVLLRDGRFVDQGAIERLAALGHG